jgi:hypothetical protein
MALIPAFSAAQFDTVINITSWRDKAPKSIGSNTQLNVSGFGTLPDGFRAGAVDGSSRNVELNFSGHRADSIDVFGGVTANLNHGAVWGVLIAHGGSVVNLSGDVTFLRFFQAAHGSTVNILGGYIDAYSAALEGSHVSISGGTVKDSFTAVSGSTVHLSGGTLGDGFSFRDGSELVIFGDDFRVAGVNVDGLAQPGDSIRIDLPPEAVLSGNLADRTPFAFSGQDGDEIANGSLLLTRAVVAPAEPGSIVINDQSPLVGARHRQHLTIQQGGILRQHFNAGAGSRIDVEGGAIGAYFEAVGANINIINGFIGESFDAFDGSVVKISGGVVDANFDAMNGSVVQITDGQIGPYFNAHAGSRVLISGGSFGKGFRALEGSSVLISGGELAERFYAHDASHVTIAGGKFGDDFRAYDGSSINIRGTEFFLDGQPIRGLVIGLPTLISDRNVILSGRLADGSLFQFELISTDYERSQWGAWVPYDFFATGAFLTVTHVPEPVSTLLVIIGLAYLFSTRLRIKSGQSAY